MLMVFLWPQLPLFGVSCHSRVPHSWCFVLSVSVISISSKMQDNSIWVSLRFIWHATAIMDDIIVQYDGGNDVSIVAEKSASDTGAPIPASSLQILTISFRWIWTSPPSTHFKSWSFLHLLIDTISDLASCRHIVWPTFQQQKVSSWYWLKGNLISSQRVLV